MINKKYKKLKRIENKINKNLFFICGIVTVITMAMILVEFFSKGAFSPARIDLFYLGVLIIYSFHKELIRWIGERKVERQGEYFVYGWILLTTALYLVNFLNHDYYVFSDQGERLYVLRDLSFLTLEVFAIFIITRSLKILKNIIV